MAKAEVGRRGSSDSSNALTRAGRARAGRPCPGSPQESLPEGCEELRRSEAVDSSDMGEGRCQGLSANAPMITHGFPRSAKQLTKRHKPLLQVVYCLRPRCEDPRLPPRLARPGPSPLAPLPPAKVCG